MTIIESLLYLISNLFIEVGRSLPEVVMASSPTLKVSERWYDNAHCPNGRATNHWETDGEKTKIGEDPMEKGFGRFQGGGYDTFVINNATYAIRVETGNGGGYVSSIVLWSNCDEQKVGNTVAKIVLGYGTDLEYLEALKDRDAAFRWITGRYEYRENTQLFSLGVNECPNEVAELFYRHDGLRELFPPSRKYWYWCRRSGK